MVIVEAHFPVRYLRLELPRLHASCSLRRDLAHYLRGRSFFVPYGESRLFMVINQRGTGHPLASGPGVGGRQTKLGKEGVLDLETRSQTKTWKPFGR